MNVLNMSIKLHICTINDKRDILDQTIKVKKNSFKSTYPVIIVQSKFHQSSLIEGILALLMIYDMFI